MAYFEQLTKGALGHMLEDRKIEQPILQMLAYKNMPTDSAKRYRLVVSDGAYTYQCCIMMGDYADKVENNYFDRFCLIKVCRYMLNEIQGRQVIVLAEPRLLVKGSEVGERLGDPVPYGSDGAPPLSKFKPNYHLSEKNDDMELEFGDDPFGDIENAKTSRNNFQQAKKMKTPTKASTSGMSNQTRQLNPELVCPISAINPYTNKWTIKGRCVSKTNKRSWSNAKGEGTLFSFDLQDASADIRLTAFKAECEKYFDMIKVGEVYLVSKGMVKNANKQYSKSVSDYEISLTQETIVEHCADENDCPAVTYDLKPFDQLTDSLGSFVDIIGIIKTLNQPETVQKKNTNKELIKRDLQLVDQTGTEILFTLWGENAADFKGEAEDVLMARAVRVTEFNGFSLSMTANSHIEINPDNDRAMELKGWYSRVKNSLETNNLSSKNAGTFAAAWANLNEINPEKVSESGLTIQTKAVINQFGKTSFYKGCKECNKKLLDLNNGFYRCEKCGTDTSEFKYRLIMKFSVSDHTGNLWVDCFHDEAMKILGDVNLQEFYQLYETQQPEFEDRVKQRNFKTFVFKIRARMEHFNDEERIRSLVSNLQTVNYVDYGKILIKKIREG